MSVYFPDFFRLTLRGTSNKRILDFLLFVSLRIAKMPPKAASKAKVANDFQLSDSKSIKKFSPTFSKLP